MPKKIISLDELSRFKSDYDANLKTLNGVALYGGGNYTFDDEFSEISTNAVENKVISLAVKEINYELAVIRESLFEVLLTELDYKVSYAMSYAVPDTLSDSDGTHRVVYSETMLKEVEGNGVALNQLLINGNFADGTQYWSGGTLSANNNVLTISFTGYNPYTGNTRSLPIPQGHKVLATYTLKASVSGTVVLDSNGLFHSNSGSMTLTANEKKKGVFILTSQTSTPKSMYWYPNSQSSAMWVSGETMTMENIMFIDLTQMFGAGNEPTTTDDTRIQWLLSQDYIPYNTGSLANTTISGVRIKDSNGNVISTISIPQTTLLGALNSHDTISVVEGNVVEGEQLYNLVLTSNVGTVDLGTLSWTYYQDGIFYSQSLTNRSLNRNGLCSKYAYEEHDYSNWQNLSDKSFCMSNANVNIYIRDTSYTNAATFKTAMNGVMSQYQLATPTQTTIATDLEFDQVSSLIEQGGSIEPIFTNVPPNLTTTFVVKKAVGE